MATAASGLDAIPIANTPRQRLRPDALQSLNPTSQIKQRSKYYISAEHGPAIEDELVWQVARYWLGVELVILEFLEGILYRIAGEDEECLALAQNVTVQFPRDLVELQELMQGISKVMNGASVHRDYLTQRNFLPYWNGAYNILRRVAHEQQTPEKLASVTTVRNTVYAMMRRLAAAAQPLPVLLLRAVQEGRLDYETQKAIREKWLVMDSMVNATVAAYSNWDRDITSWASVNEDMIKAAAANPPGIRSSTTPSIWPSIMLWLAFSVTVISTIPTCALGWRYSDHLPGSTGDADFWFLVQNSCMGVLNLSILALPLIKEKVLSGYLWIQLWTWGYLLLGILSALMAPMAYIYMPTEWSAYMSVLFGIIQVAVTWQIAVLADQKSLGSVRVKNE